MVIEGQKWNVPIERSMALKLTCLALQTYKSFPNQILINKHACGLFEHCSAVIFVCTKQSINDVDI